VAGARERLAEALPLPAITPLSAAALAAAGLTETDREAVAALVETYNRGNLTNLILLTALRRALEGTPAEPGPPPPAIPAPAMLPMPPPLPRLSDLPPPLAKAVLALAARHGGSGVVPSLYLHLAHWPGIPPALPAWLGDALAPATIAVGREEAVRLAAREADAIRPALELRGEVPNGQRAAMLSALDRFTRQVIPAMVPIGLALRRVLAQG
jgi:hypothetical protein